jgi:phosphatidylserine/phosphatidylglycerophosphate/cardiolipin synthase-like enzyme
MRRGQSLTNSQLYDQDNFYKSFISDIKRAKKQVIIESPFITNRRVNTLLPVLSKLSKRGVLILVNTKDPGEVDQSYRNQVEDAISRMQAANINVLYTGGHHRKLAVIDNNIIWEGSLNILSHNDSCEIMRRIESSALTEELIAFIKLKRFIS